MTRRRTLENRLEDLETDDETDLETLFMADLRVAHGHAEDVDPHLREQLADGVLEEQLAESVAPGGQS